MPIVDDLIDHHCRQADDRPHQIFFTGDQIYGDDVADPLLFALTDAGDTLLGWEEDLPIEPSSTSGTVEFKPKHLEPGQRSKVAESLGGFTAGIHDKPEYAKSHLLGLGEYCAMYLFSWSQVLWADEFPDGKDICTQSKQANRWNKEVKTLRTGMFQMLWKARRALANVPTYMIFDDHDISDDWYLNQAWCLRVLGKPLGRRSVQNGILAYALFQAWGNTPDRFEPGQLGEKLLMAAATWSASEGTDSTTETAIARYLGLPPIDSTTGLPRFKIDSTTGLSQLNQDDDVLILDRDPFALNWNYTVRSKYHEMIVLDTRTWRGYPLDQSTSAPPMLLSPTAFDRQLRQPLKESNRLKQSGVSQVEITLVIAPTNLVSLEAIDQIQHWNLKQGKMYNNDVGDAWNINKLAFAKLLMTMFEQRDRIIILSGDIHYSSVVCLHYWKHDHDRSGLDAFEKPHVLAQLTSSAIKNAEWKTQLVHTKLKSLLPERSQDWAGWNHPPELLSVRSILGNVQVKSLPVPSQIPVVQRLYRTRSARSPWTVAVSQTQFLPDWRYHIDWINRQPAQTAFQFASSKKHNASWLKRAIDSVKLLWRNRWLQEGREVVGTSNIGLVHFDWSTQPDRKAVMQDTFWYAPWRGDRVVFSRLYASLELEDPPPPLQVITKSTFTDPN